MSYRFIVLFCIYLLSFVFGIVLQESTQIEKNDCDSKPVEESDHDPHYDPIISLPEVKVPTLEEDEIIMLTL